MQSGATMKTVGALLVIATIVSCEVPAKFRGCESEETRVTNDDNKLKKEMEMLELEYHQLFENNVEETLRSMKCSRLLEKVFRYLYGECSFPGFDLEVALDEFLQRLPASYEIPNSGSNGMLPGLSFGNIYLLGLSTLEVRGAPRPFCRKGSPMLEVSLSTRAALRFIAPWRYCSTLSGKLSTTSSYVTLNALFEVGEDKLAPIDVWLTWLEGTYVLLDGAPEPLNMAVAILSKLAPAVVRDFWVEETAWRSKDVFKAVATSGKN